MIHKTTSLFLTCCFASQLAVAAPNPAPQEATQQTATSATTTQGATTQGATTPSATTQGTTAQPQPPATNQAAAHGWKLRIGEKPPAITLKGDGAGRLSGEPWSSSELVGKVHMLVYSNVDARDLNNEATSAVKKEAFPRDRFASVAVINMKGSWQPNFIIASKLKDKQQEFPDTLYVKDMDYTLHKAWGLSEKSNDIVLLDSEGRILYAVKGQLNGKQITALVDLIKGQLNKAATQS